MSDTSLFRTAGVLAVLCGALLAVDKLVPDSFWVSTLGVCAGLLGLLILTALWLGQRARAGPLGDLGWALNSIGLALMVGVSFIFNYAFPHLNGAASEAFFASSGWTVIRASYALYALGVLVFGLSMWRAAVFPRTAVLLYTAGFLVAWSSFALGLPQSVDSWGTLAAAVGIALLGGALFRRTPTARAA